MIKRAEKCSKKQQKYAPHVHWHVHTDSIVKG